MFGVPTGDEGRERNLAKLTGDGALVPPSKHADDLLFNGAATLMSSETEATPACTSNGDQVETRMARVPVVLP
jgi:hypothetical protein